MQKSKTIYNSRNSIGCVAFITFKGLGSLIYNSRNSIGCVATDKPVTNIPIYNSRNSIGCVAPKQKSFRITESTIVEIQLAVWPFYYDAAVALIYNSRNSIGCVARKNPWDRP